MGRLTITADGNAICTVTYDTPSEMVGATPIPRAESTALESRGETNDPLIDEAASQLRAYFTGRLLRFDLPLAPDGTAFQQRVWRALEQIPFAETRSYGEVAMHIGQPTASRAVGGANHRNPIAIVIPCHRVIGAKGELTGYASGLERKRWLLDHEHRVRETH